MFSFCAISVFFSIFIVVNSQSVCFTPEGINGVCVSIYNCPNVLAQFQGSLSPAMTFYLRSLQCAGSIGRYPHVCCIAPNIIPQQQQQPQQQRPQQRPQRPQGRQATRLRPLGRSSGTGHLIPGFGTCGLTSLAQRIFGGEETQLDEYPWMAIFEYRRRNQGENKLSCGGSLINTRYVLTAAHCLVGEILTRVGDLVGVRLGEYDTTKEIDCLGNNCADPVLYMGVEEVVAHEWYNERSKNRENDVGLIRMDGDVTYTDYIKPICLPTTVQSQRSTPNEKLTSAGWGRTLQASKSATKLSVELPLVNQNSCVNRYRVVGIDIIDSQLCAGGVYGRDTCDGDSGNPLMKIWQGVWVVEGIVSFGRGCGQAGWPAVYTRVESYEPWVRQNLRP